MESANATNFTESTHFDCRLRAVIVVVARAVDVDEKKYCLRFFTCECPINYTFYTVPAKWILAPNDTEAVVGQNVIIDCAATGNPLPHIWWEMSSGQMASANGYRTVISNSHIHILENGSLVIREVMKNDEGYYLCQANNRIGPGLSKVIKLTVHGKRLAARARVLSILIWSPQKSC